jgi:hypothetical protein
MRVFAAILLISCSVALAPGVRAQSPWSISLYGGATTDTITTQIAAGHLHIIGGMIGLAANRRLAYLGSGFSLAAEGQVAQYLTHDPYQTVSLGIGASYDRFPWNAPSTLALYIGPSYAFDPPAIAGQTHPFLNYVSAEFAVQIPQAPQWDAALRLFHRSGAWGLYAHSFDQGTMVGAGLRYRF